MRYLVKVQVANSVVTEGFGRQQFIHQMPTTNIGHLEAKGEQKKMSLEVRLLLCMENSPQPHIWSWDSDSNSPKLFPWL